MQFKQFPLELKREPDDDGIIEGYASVFDVVDNGLDVVNRGAFKNSLGKRKVRMLWQHMASEPIGVWDEIKEDDRGLYVKGRILKDVSRGKDAIALYKGGAMDSLSIGYIARESVDEGNGRIRRLTEIDLFEISCVTMPMLDAATASVKGLKTPRDFERFLRDAGYSRKEAVAITNHGFKAINDERDAAADGLDQETARAVMDQIKRLQEILKCQNKSS